MRTAVEQQYDVRRHDLEGRAKVAEAQGDEAREEASKVLADTAGEAGIGPKSMQSISAEATAGDMLSAGPGMGKNSSRHECLPLVSLSRPGSANWGPARPSEEAVTHGGGNPMALPLVPVIDRHKERKMSSFIGKGIGGIFLIGLFVVIGLLTLIF